MIKLTKIVLINWMYFQKVTLPLEGNCAIVGVNGAGKSTIIDAIQLLLLGQKSARFNANANAEKRTLESYVRGQINVENKPYLRTGDVVTYLALEIVENGVKHILGINVEYKSIINKLDGPKYFYVKNMDLSESIFIKDNYPKTYDDLSRELKKNYEYVSFPTLLSYQLKIKDILGLKDETTYFKTLSRAVGIKNITDCNTFMTEFVLDENNIDVSSIKNNIQEIEKVSKTIENEQLKLAMLNSVIEVGDCIDANNIELTNEKIKNTVLNIEYINQNINNLLNNNSIHESKLLEFDNQKKIHADTLNELNSSNYTLTNSLNQISPELSQMKSRLNDLEKEYESVHLDLNTFKTLCNKEIANLSTLKRFKNEIFDSFYTYLEAGEYTSETARKAFVDFRDEAESVSKVYRDELARMKTQKEEYRQQLVELNAIITKLNNNQFEYKKELKEFLSYIKNGLREKYNQDVEVNFLCEYLEITDNNWRNAIEGYLGNQRFYIIVPNEYYVEALKLYDARKDFYQTRIIDGTKIPEFDYEQGVLGEFVESSNMIALNYSRYILNRVHCVKNIYELNKYDIAITKECMLYQGYSTGRINPRLYKEQYIGQEGIKNQLKLRLEQKEMLNEQANELIGKYNKLSGMINTVENEGKFASKIIENNALFKSIDKDSKMFDLIEKIREDINFYESNPKYIEITAKIAENDDKISKCKKAIDEIDSLVIDHKSNIKSNNDNILIEKNNLIQFEDKLNGISLEIINNIKEQVIKQKITLSMINKNALVIKNLETDILKKKFELEGLMKEARNVYNINLEPKFESLNAFKDERNSINQTVFKHQSKFVDLKKKYINLFFSQFLTKLYNLIDGARKTVDNLNYSLSVFPFGNDYYKIKMSITSDKDLEYIYNYAKEYNSDDSERGLFMDREAEDKARNKIMDILNDYMFSDDSKIRERIVDYRKYLYFDVEVDTPNGVKKLNEVMKTQSGGEVQVPFYILSGVAFQQTLDVKRRKDDCLGIVLYDEAFDKMDSQRIQSMLQFYRDKLKLQLILAAPGKLDSLVDNIETILVVVSDGKTSIVSDYNHEI